jgi:hypothetical protein
MSSDDDRHQVTATIGPWTGTVLTMSKTEADQAVADGWAVERSAPPYDMAVPRNEYPGLSEQARAQAEAAAWAWTDAFNQLILARVS